MTRYYKYYSDDDDAIGKYSLKFDGDSFGQFGRAVHCYQLQNSYVILILYKRVIPIARLQRLVESHLSAIRVNCYQQNRVSSRFQLLEPENLDFLQENLSKNTPTVSNSCSPIKIKHENARVLSKLLWQQYIPHKDTHKSSVTWQLLTLTKTGGAVSSRD